MKNSYFLLAAILLSLAVFSATCGKAVPPGPVDSVTKTPAPRMELDLQSGNMKFMTGEIPYYISISNTGDAPAKSIEVQDILAAEMNYLGSEPAGEFIPASGQLPARVVWRFDAIPAGGVVNLTVKVKLPFGKRDGIRNLVRVVSTSIEPPLIQPLERSLLIESK